MAAGLGSPWGVQGSVHACPLASRRHHAPWFVAASLISSFSCLLPSFYGPQEDMALQFRAIHDYIPILRSWTSVGSCAWSLHLQESLFSDFLKGFKRPIGDGWKPSHRSSELSMNSRGLGRDEDW